jgi:hypothetical protein
MWPMIQLWVMTLLHCLVSAPCVAMHCGVSLATSRLQRFRVNMTILLPKMRRSKNIFEVAVEETPLIPYRARIIILQNFD